MQSYPHERTLYVISFRQTRDLPVVSLFPHPASFRFPSRGHPCLRLYPSHCRADSGLAPVRNVRRQAHIYQAAVHTRKTAAFLLFLRFPFPASSELLYFQGIRKSWEKKEEKREERKQKRRRNNSWQQSCFISTAGKKCLIKKKTLNKEENSPSFQSLAFLSASVQQKLQSAISKKLFCRNIVSFILLNAPFF